MNHDLNCISFWYPCLLSAGIPMPKTEIVEAPEWRTEAESFLMWLIDDGADTPATDRLVSNIAAACKRVAPSGPYFLRSGHFSGKHEWERTCYLPDYLSATIADHVKAIAYLGELVSFIGFPWDVWVVREMLNVRADDVAFFAVEYENMPVRREYRAFVDSMGVVRCVHPYWPADALKKSCAVAGNAAELERINGAIDFHGPVMLLAEKAGRALARTHESGWSVDILRDEKGVWMVTDCAVARDSFHWAGCPNGGAA